MTADQVPAIFAALADVMADVDHVAKRDHHDQQRFNFRGVDAVVNAVGPILRKHRVVVVPDVQHVEYQPIHTRNGAIMTSARVVVGYAFYAVDGSSVRTVVAAEAFDAGDKATPKAMSVAFRTALLQALALPTDDPDPDATSYEQVAPPAEQAPPAQTGQTMRRGEKRGPDAPASQAQVGMIAGLCTKLGVVDRDARLAFVGGKLNPPRDIGSGKELTSREASGVIEILQADVAALEDMAAADQVDEPEAQS